MVTRLRLCDRQVFILSILLVPKNADILRFWLKGVMLTPINGRNECPQWPLFHGKVRSNKNSLAHTNFKGTCVFKGVLFWHLNDACFLDSCSSGSMLKEFS